MGKTIGYSSIAGSYNELYGEEQEEKLAAINLRIPKQAILLDLGCGTGIASSKYSCTRIGLDSSIEMLTEAKGMLRVCGAAENLPFKDEAFDFVICLTAIHNFSDYGKAIDEMKRVCKGALVVSVLKRSRLAGEILHALRGRFKVYQEIDTEKDTILKISSQIQ